MNVQFEDIISVYVPAASIVQLIDEEDKLLRACIKGGLSIQGLKRLEVHENELRTCVRILQKSTDNLFKGEARAFIPDYDGGNYELFEKITKAIDDNLPDDQLNESTLEAAKRQLKATLQQERCLISTRKKTLSDVKRESASIREKLEKESKMQQNVEHGV